MAVTNLYPPTRPTIEHIAPTWRAARRHSPAFYLVATAASVIGVLAFLNVLPMLVITAGISGFVTSTVLAVIPLAFTFLFVYYIDRFEPEPKRLYFVAFVWGGGVAVVLALMGNTWWQLQLAPQVLGPNASQNDIMRFTASVGAPLIEEFIKGLGVIFILVMFRKYFNGPVDGIVYGAIIGGGFAFTENILYFTNHYDQVGEVFRIRFLDGPLSHDVYTAFFGFFIGFAVYARSRRALIGWFVPAMAGSMLFHFVNNDGLYWMSYDAYKFVNNVPVAMLMIAMVLYSRNREVAAVRNGLRPYVNSGWVSANEVNMVLSIRERESAKNWAERTARAHGAPPGRGRKAMNTFQMELVQLAHERTRHERQGTVATPEYFASANDKLQHLNVIRNGLALA